MNNTPAPMAQRIAAEIRAEMGRQNLSKRALADRIGHPHVTVSRWVNGGGGMTFDALYEICEVLGISLPELFARVERRQRDEPDAPKRRRVDAHPRKAAA